MRAVGEVTSVAQLHTKHLSPPQPADTCMEGYEMFLQVLVTMLWKTIRVCDEDGKTAKKH